MFFFIQNKFSTLNLHFFDDIYLLRSSASTCLCDVRNKLLVHPTSPLFEVIERV